MKSLCAYSFFEHICTCTSVVTGDDWEHEEIFTDDDEGVDNPDEREDLDPEVPAPPEIKQVSFQSKFLYTCEM
jgi:hypothetical protein